MGSTLSSTRRVRQLWARGADALIRVSTNSALRAETAWVVGNKLAEFAIGFASLKVLTSLLREEVYGEFNLALTAVVLAGNALILPMNQAYLRHYHAAEASGESHAAGVSMLRWYTVVTVVISVAAAALSSSACRWFGLERWTTLAAGLVFAGYWWRHLAITVFTIRRQRRVSAVQEVGYLLLQFALVTAAVCLIGRTATVGLLGYAVAGAVYAFIGMTPIVRTIRAQPTCRNSGLMKLVITYGIPYGALMVSQWVQGFADRYMVGILMDLESVGKYVAAFQVCGVPYMLLQTMLYALLTPVAYQRAKDITNPAQLWSADKLLLGGVAAYAALGAAMLIVYLLCGQQLIILLTNSRYLLPVGTIVLLAVGRYLQILANLMQIVFAVHQNMKISFWFRMVGVFLTIPICWVTIRPWGLHGAALGSLLANVAYAVLLCFGPGGCVTMIRRNRRRMLAMTATAPAGNQPPTESGVDLQ